MSADVPRDPALETVLELLGEQIVYGLRTHLPGMITTYDAAKQRATVKLLVKDGHVGESSEREAISLPEVSDAIVMFVGPKNGRWTYPVAKGDLCLVSFCSSSIEVWRQVGGEVDPRDDRRHDISDAVAIVGLHHFADVPTTAPLDAVVLHSQITIKLGEPAAAQSVIRGDSFRGALDTLLTALDTFAAANNSAADLQTAITDFKATWGTHLSSRLKIP